MAGTSPAMTELHVALWIPGPALTRRPGMTREKVIPGRAFRGRATLFMAGLVPAVPKAPPHHQPLRRHCRA